MIRILVASLALAAGAAFAALDDAPMRGDGAAQTSAGTTAAGAQYTVAHRTLRSGIDVDEYVDAAGKVFAVTWSGPFKPDLRRLLGRHFDDYRKGSEARHGGSHSRLAVDTGGAVVVSEGHMGAFQGRAWVPSRLPAGFDTQEMK